MSGSTPFILIAEADAGISSLLHTLFRTRGYRTQTARDEGGCMALLTEEYPALILLSSTLSPYGAAALCRRVRACTDGRTPILLLMHDPIEALEELVEAGMSDCLPLWLPKALIAQRVEMYLHAAALETAEHDQRQFADAMREIAGALNSTLNLDEVLDRILAMVLRVVPHDQMNMMLIQDGWAQVVRCRGYLELDENVLSQRYPVMETRNLRTMYQTGEPIIIPDVDAYEGWLKHQYTSFIRSYVGVPIRLHNQVIGYLNLDSNQPNTFTAEDVQHLQAFADQAAIAIHNAHLFEQVRRYAEMLEQRVEERTRELNAERAQMRIVSTVSHELRNPLTNFRTRLYLARKQPAMWEHHLDILDEITDQMHELVENVLDAARAGQGGGIPLQREEITLQSVIDNVLRHQQPEADKKHIGLRADLPPAPLRLYADPRRLGQVITNLVVNAINYTGENGYVHVSAVADDSTGVIVRVEDNGVGISPEHLTQIFEPFYRAHEGGRGAGLGLSIAQQIVELHGGSITVQSELGKGSAFLVRLPLLNGVAQHE
jgi:signal transduction histidine kinase/CheY-like chemotaxis protein